MKLQIENLKAQMTGSNLNVHQRAEALIEFNKLLDYIESLEIKAGIPHSCVNCDTIGSIELMKVCSSCGKEY